MRYGVMGYRFSTARVTETSLRIGDPDPAGRDPHLGRPPDGRGKADVIEVAHVVCARDERQKKDVRTRAGVFSSLQFRRRDALALALGLLVYCPINPVEGRVGVEPQGQSSPIFRRKPDFPGVVVVGKDRQ